MNQDRDQEVANLEQLLDRIAEAARENEQVTLSSILDKLGSRSFGPWLLLVGVITLAPVIGDIPGVPTLMAAILLLITVQLLIGRRHLWLPQWMVQRSVSRGKVEKTLQWTRRPARFIDRLLRPRLTMFAHGAATYAIAAACLLIALAMPPMEFVPFSANGAGLALTAFGLGLMARDGLLALLAFGVTIATFGAVAYGLL